MHTAPVAFTIPACGTLSLLDGRWLVTSFGDPDDDLLALDDERASSGAQAGGVDDAVDILLVPARPR
ncbi:MAG: hypothetical protein KGL43_11305 [Burkholderiales bacterium]|nr:hypothetical protein [Burkholderiales bacterium]MDE2395107.1 hypothetical protein [Burkholderiales bacterium]MDE2454169.1 hypothetical protein [Burkholderiales bacterium]